MPAPLFSVVMPLRDKATHVRAAIESALAQSFSPLEIVVIENCSTDGSAERAREIEDMRVRLLEIDQPSPGGYRARNHGIRQARGDWIAFLDADDLWRPGHLAALAEAMAAQPSAGGAATRFDHLFADRRQSQRIAPGLANGALLEFEDFMRAWLAVRECPVWTGAAAFRRDVLLTAGLFPENGAVRGGDKDLWLRAARVAPIAYDARVTADFHRDATNKVSKSTGTGALPCLVATARAMMEEASPAERALLRRLVNQEIAHYARYALKSDQAMTIGFGDIYLPEGARAAALLLAARALPASLRRRAYGARQKALARG